VDELIPVSEWYTGADGLTVRVTLPYEAGPLFDADPVEVPGAGAAVGAGGAKVGRNDPCPCGSGRKYKKCCLRRGAPRPEPGRRPGHEPDPIHDLDEELVYELIDFAVENLGAAWRRRKEPFTHPDETSQLSYPWAVYHHRVEGETVVERYLREQGHRLSRQQRAWLVAQQAAWLSIWEVTAVDPGVGLTARDLLSGEVREVHEVTASRMVLVRDVLLARVVDYDGRAFISGLYPCSLPPMAAVEVERRGRRWLRRKREVPVERLRDDRFGRFLIRRWEEAVAELGRQSASPRGS